MSALAYRSGTRLIDKKNARAFDFRDKAVYAVHILPPKDAPAWSLALAQRCQKNLEDNLQTFCDLIEEKEKREDAQVYREIEFSLPLEFSPSQNIAVVHEFVANTLSPLGILAIANFHFQEEKDGPLSYPHCHLLLLLRRLTPDGLATQKERDWNQRSYHMAWRQAYAAHMNKHLAQNGLEARLDARSYGARAIPLLSQPKHYGAPAALAPHKKNRLFFNLLQVASASSLPQASPHWGLQNEMDFLVLAEKYLWGPHEAAFFFALLSLLGIPFFGGGAEAERRSAPACPFAHEKEKQELITLFEKSIFYQTHSFALEGQKGTLPSASLVLGLIFCIFLSQKTNLLRVDFWKRFVHILRKGSFFRS